MSKKTYLIIAAVVVGLIAAYNVVKAKNVLGLGAVLP